MPCLLKPNDRNFDRRKEMRSRTPIVHLDFLFRDYPIGEHAGNIEAANGGDGDVEYLCGQSGNPGYLLH